MIAAVTQTIALAPKTSRSSRRPPHTPPRRNEGRGVRDGEADRDGLWSPRHERLGRASTAVYQRFMERPANLRRGH